MIFDAMDAAGSGLHTYRTWLDAIANNIANVNTVRPANEEAFKAQYVRAQTIAPDADGIGGGVQAVELVHQNDNDTSYGNLAYQPDNPMADKNGYIKLPDVDLSEQMGDLIMAQRSFQANAATVDRVRDSYQAAIDIGKKI